MKLSDSKCITECGYLRSHQGLAPGQPLLLVVGGRGGVIRKGRLSLLRRPSLPLWGGFSFLLLSNAGRGNFLRFPPVFVDGICLTILGRRVIMALRRRPFLVPAAAFLDLSASPDGAAFFFFFFSPLRGRSAPHRLRTRRPVQPCTGDPSWSPWPSFRPSSLAPCKAPELASPSGARLLDLPAAEPDSRSAPPSPPTPVWSAW